ncbi:MAG: SDR family oxidoreductase [Halanaerobiaceae bacterium]
MKILITGASGTVGQHVVRELMKKDEKIVAAGTDPKKLLKIFGDGIEAVRFDFTDKSTFSPALKDVNRVFLMRPPHLGKPDDLYPFIDALAAREIKLVSFLSLMGVEKNPFPPHHKIEKYIEEAGIPFAHIRPGFFMQNLSGIHSVEIRENDEILVPAGKSKTSFIDAADIGLAIATVLNNPEKYQNTKHTITGPEALDYYEIADILSEVTGRKIEYNKPGFLRYRSHYIKERGFDKKYVNITMALYLMTRLGTAKKITDDFKKITGKAPRSFREFARDNLEAFQKNKGY